MKSDKIVEKITINPDELINKIFYKSSTNMEEIPDNSIDLIITSPPYFNIKDYSKDGAQKKWHSCKNIFDIGSFDNYDTYIKKLLVVWKECFRILKPNGKLCINVPLMPMIKSKFNTHYNRHIFDIQSDIQNSIIKNTDFYLYDLYIWNRTNSTKKIMFGSYPYPNNFYNQNIIEFITIYVKDGKRQEKISDTKKERSKLSKNEWINYTKQIWDIPIPNRSDLAFGAHSAIMPEEIPRRLIKMFSFVDDIVLDPFAGSGTTLKVAKELKRNYIGYELYENYKSVIEKKVNNNKNNKIKVNDFINSFITKDVFKALDILDDELFDLIIADPPYNVNVDEWDQFENEEKFFEFTKKWISLCIKKLKPNGSFYVFNTAKNSAKLLEYIENENMFFQNWIIWYKKDGFSASKKRFNNNQETILFFTKNSSEYTFNYDKIRVPYNSTERMKTAKTKGITKNGKKWYPNKNGKLCTDVWEFTSERHNKKKNGKVVKLDHPTQKPEKMIERIILASSNENDLILDLFSGSGTTAFIAKKNKRRFIAIEKSKKYVELAQRRINEAN